MAESTDPAFEEENVQQILVAISSDDGLLCEGLSHIIAADSLLSMVGQLATTVFGPALRAAGAHVLLVDSRMPNALEVCAAVKRDGGPAVILFMAPRDDNKWAVDALAAGARGVLAKDARAQDLVKAIHVVRDGQIWARRQAIEAWVGHMAGRLPDERISRLEQVLSDREKEVFRYAATGLTNKELAQRLAISEATVKVHLTHIFQKLGLRGRSELAATYHDVIPPSPDRNSPGGILRRPA